MDLKIQQNLTDRTKLRQWLVKMRDDLPSIAIPKVENHRFLNILTGTVGALKTIIDAAIIETEK